MRFIVFFGVESKVIVNKLQRRKPADVLVFSAQVLASHSVSTVQLTACEFLVPPQCLKKNGTFVSRKRINRGGRNCGYSSSRNCSTVRPASRTIPPMVNAFTGLWRGIVRIRPPLDITICFPWRTIWKPLFQVHARRQDD